MRKTGYIALSIYLLLVGLSAIVPNFIVPNSLMVVLVLTASLGIFLDTCIPVKKIDYRGSYTLPGKNSDHNLSG